MTTAYYRDLAVGWWVTHREGTPGWWGIVALGARGWDAFCSVAK